jgi:hypothetical protein
MNQESFFSYLGSSSQRMFCNLRLLANEIQNALAQLQAGISAHPKDSLSTRGDEAFGRADST